MLEQSQVRRQRLEKGIVKIEKHDLLQAIDYINNNSSYTPEEYHRDEFMRSVLRAVTIGNVAQFKELMEMNEEFGYDYRTLFKNYNKEGLSVLHVACQNGRVAIIEKLLTDYGFADELNNDQNKLQQTAFFLAVQSFVLNNRPPERLQLMVNHGADILVRPQGISVKKFLALSQLKNDCTELLSSIYNEKERERSLKMAIWVMKFSSVRKTDPRIFSLNNTLQDAVLELL